MNTPNASETVSTTTYNEPPHEDLIIGAATATYHFGNGIVSSWTWRRVGPTVSPILNRDHLYTVTITYPANNSIFEGLSLATLGLQGAKHDVELVHASNAQIGRQDNANPTGMLTYLTANPPETLSSIGLDPTNNRLLNENGIWFVKPLDQNLPIVLQLKQQNGRIVGPHMIDEKSGHDNVPPPFPPGSSEGD